LTNKKIGRLRGKACLPLQGVTRTESKSNFTLFALS
jgi:hypothetical protein